MKKMVRRVRRRRRRRRQRSGALTAAVPPVLNAAAKSALLGQITKKAKRATNKDLKVLGGRRRGGRR